MCKFHIDSKTCPLGNRCHFAHGKDEIRKMGDKLPNTPFLSGPKIPMPGNNEEDKTVGIN